MVPIDLVVKGPPLIMLFKTQIYAPGENGDSKLLMNIQRDTTKSPVDSDFRKWIYPTDQAHLDESATGKSNSPEIIEACEERLTEECGTGPGCAMIIGVVGTSTVTSSYRLKAFFEQNKLKLNTPMTSTFEKMVSHDQHYEYFWFAINDTVEDRGKVFDYQVTVQTADGFNPDLYVSLMDGRFPTAQDFDMASTLLGADTIRISSKDSLWARRGWDTSVGVVVVVGVALK